MTVVSLVALFYFGHVAYASVALGTLAYGALVRHHFVPLSIQKTYESISPWVAIAGNLTSGFWLLQLVATIELVDKVDAFLTSNTVLTPYEQTPPQANLQNMGEFERVYSGIAQLEVNRAHVTISPFPANTTTDFQPILDFCEQFSWNEDQLKQRISGDARWIRLEPKPTELEYAKTSFTSLVNAIQNESIETSEILDYSMLKRYLGFIQENLPKAPPEIQQQVMFQLAIEGGDYCGTGIYFQLESATTALMGLNDRLPLSQRLLFILQQERLRIVEAFHVHLSMKNPGFTFWRGGKGDIHAMNTTIGLIGDRFGLPDQGAASDKTAALSGLEKRLIRWFLSVNRERLWTGIEETDFLGKKTKIQGYDVERVVKAVKSQIGLPLLPQSDIYTWAQEWATRQSTNTDTFQTNLTNGTYERFNGTIYDNFIKAMLVDMGILKIKTQSSPRPG